MKMVKKSVMTALIDFPDTSPAEFDRIEYVQGPWYFLEDFESRAVLKTGNFCSQSLPKASLVRSNRTQTILTCRRVASSKRPVIDA